MRKKLITDISDVMYHLTYWVMNGPERYKLTLPGYLVSKIHKGHVTEVVTLQIFSFLLRILLLSKFQDLPIVTARQSLVSKLSYVENGPAGHINNSILES